MEIAMRPNALPAGFHTSPHISVSDIQEAVAAHYGIPAIEMRSERRSRAVSWPRQDAMYLARELTPYSYPRLGAFFGNRDHTTILHGVRRVEKRIAESEEYLSRINTLRERLVPRKRQRILDQIEDPKARKMLIMSWWERGHVSGKDAKALIRDNALASA